MPTCRERLGVPWSTAPLLWPFRELQPGTQSTTSSLVGLRALDSTRWPSPAEPVITQPRPWHSPSVGQVPRPSALRPDPSGLGKVMCVPYAGPGSDKLREAVSVHDLRTAALLATPSPQ